MAPVIRPATVEDANVCADIYRPYVTDTVISFETTAPDASAIARRILDAHLWLVVEEDNEVVGYAYGSQHRTREAYQWSCDVSVYLRQGLQGKGYGRLLYNRLLHGLAGLGYQSAFAGVALPNVASEKLHLSMGFEPVGTYRKVGYKDSRWLDVRWFQRALGTHPQGPQPPRRAGRPVPQ